MVNHSPYCCISPGCHRAPLSRNPEGLACPHGHLFAFIPGTTVPLFASEPEGANEYSFDNAAEFHDNALRWVFSTFETDEASLRERLIARLELGRGARVLVTGAGAGDDLPYLVRALSGDGEIFAQDIAKQMLLAAISRYHAELPISGVNLQF